MTDAGSNPGSLSSLAPGLIAALRELGGVWRCRWRRAVPRESRDDANGGEAVSGVGLRLSAAGKMASRGNGLVL